MSTNPCSAKAGSTIENPEEGNMNNEHPDTDSTEPYENYLDLEGYNTYPQKDTLANIYPEKTDKKLNESEKSTTKNNVSHDKQKLSSISLTDRKSVV